MTITPINTKDAGFIDRPVSSIATVAPLIVNPDRPEAIPTKRILRNPVTAMEFEQQVTTIMQWAESRQSKAVCVANVHMLMEAYWRPEFAAVLRKAELVTPDGMPLVWMLRQLGMKTQDRVAGMDIFHALCERSRQQNLNIFFVGSTPQILDSMGAKLAQQYPGLNVVGMESLPFRPLTEQEDQELIAKIESSQANLVMVALGCPKQEYWIAQHKDKINAVMIGLGAVFAVYAGVHKHAPKWVQKSGLEWSYRLMQEPRRLFGRYSSTIPPFVWLAVKQLLTESIGDRRRDAYFESSTVKHSAPVMPAIEALGEQIEQAAMIGEILVKHRIITKTHLAQALQQQQQTGQKLGEILIQNQLVSALELEKSLKNQSIKLGQLLVRNQIISQELLEQTLQKQKRSHAKLGECLLQQGVVAPEQLENILLEQCWRRKGVWMVA
ncbi:glycosyl transferase, WecB/TagA/CpsF family [Thalassoporum mexicanum PCC 7367]|uniref:WecB/TagA/CpsF family glycosyltransferase n=1 Tax=Thalassoporum mexicanum TaxID=3457544 RepID=UPI00029FB348|nr:WecB/TagA/CpsF family glycosyltransferase [Pseudanabaena sp. PCC 7367]AFY71619.1 glycosyl transferase, WecB/TagA/CpsF family [Pseudanabaena sp. PCC 7367]